MKLLVCILFLLNATCYSQSKSLVISVKILNELRTALNVSDIHISFRDAGERIHGHFDSEYRAEFRNLFSDTLKIGISCTIKLKDSSVTKHLFVYYVLALNKDCETVLNLTFPMDCEFNRHAVNDLCPICKKNDTVIPIIYGLLSSGSFKGRFFEDYIPGGCMTTDCDPTWYCKEDKISF